MTVICDKQTRLSKGFAYVLCESPEDATLGMKEMDGRVCYLQLFCFVFLLIADKFFDNACF